MTSRAISVAWYPAYDGNSPVLSYLLQYKASASPWGERTNRSVSSALSSATVGGLLPYTEYTIQVSYFFLISAANATLHHHQVVSVNSIGVGPPSNTVTATTAEEGEFPDTFLLLTIIDSSPVPSGPPKSVRVEAVSETELRVSWQVVKQYISDLMHFILKHCGCSF